MYLVVLLEDFSKHFDFLFPSLIELDMCSLCNKNSLSGVGRNGVPSTQNSLGPAGACIP